MIHFRMARHPPDEDSCPHHDGRSHACAHESGHAIAAVERGLPFDRVSVYPSLMRYEGAQMKGGALGFDGAQIMEHRSRGLLPDMALFEIALAGRAAEEAALGDCLEGSRQEDVAVSCGRSMPPL